MEASRITGRTLQSERLGLLPIINHFIQRIGLEDLIDRYVRSDARCAVSHSRQLGVLLHSIIEESRVQVFGSGMFGVAAEEMERLGDDRRVAKRVMRGSNSMSPMDDQIAIFSIK